MYQALLYFRKCQVHQRLARGREIMVSGEVQEMINRLLIERSSHKLPQGAMLEKRGRRRGRGAARHMANLLAQVCPPPHREGSSSRVLVGVTSSSVAVPESSSCPLTKKVLIASCWMSNGFALSNISCCLGWTRGKRGGRGGRGLATKPLD